MTKFKSLKKFAVMSAAMVFCVLAAPVASTPAAAAPAATTIDMMRGLEGSRVSPVEKVGRRHHSHRHHSRRHRCRMVRRCHRVRTGWRHHTRRHCHWVRRCGYWR
ncbi:MAG: hypothetical protein KDJ45_07935 [Hyphomicrobiaceae bacterium]|nr:hypothetical protein [Hyphomicrobiaceae bacterium]MCC0009141.1 hypothetical protein [Hyphomicrobiaceae bacterium]